MSQDVALFGFGSFFRHEIVAHDIDLLIVHDDISETSIRFAIHCKSLIQAKIPEAHIVMLSEAEERDLSFLSKSKAVFLGRISDLSLQNQRQQMDNLGRRSLSRAESNLI